MSNLDSRLTIDINEFSSVTSRGCADVALKEAKLRVATITAFNGDMQRGMHINPLNKIITQVVSSSPHPGNTRFDNGKDGGTYKGTELVDDTIRYWAEQKGIDLGEKKYLKVNYANNSFHQAQGFMFNSIPSEAEVKEVADRVIKSTMRGGTVYG
jgi:hypothetical protein